MNDSKGKFSEFLNAKSMLTPGICGALTMTITNALGAAFGLVGPGRSWLCLGLSFLVGMLIFAADVKVLWQKIAFYVVNSLIIFSTAAGTNLVGQTAAGGGSTSPGTPLAAGAPDHPNPAGDPRPLPPIIGQPPKTNAIGRTNNLTDPQIQKAIRSTRFFEQWH